MTRNELTLIASFLMIVTAAVPYATAQTDTDDFSRAGGVSVTGGTSQISGSSGATASSVVSGSAVNTGTPNPEGGIQTVQTTGAGGYSVVGGTSGSIGSTVVMPSVVLGITREMGTVEETTRVGGITKPVQSTQSENANVQDEYEDNLIALSRNLYRGVSDGNEPDITSLQSFLYLKSYVGESSVTGYFGSITESAVQRYQCDMNIVCTGSPEETGWGIVGPVTRSRINSQISEFQAEHSD